MMSMENLQLEILVTKKNNEINKHKKKLYLTWVEMGHHALARGSTSLLVGEQWLGEMEMEERESGWFESKRSQSIHKHHNNMQNEECLKSDPPTCLYSFSKGF